jgi:phosphoserine phosphatase
MLTVATLIAGSCYGAELSSLANAIADPAGIFGGPVWLATGEACDLIFDSAAAPSAEAAARAAIGGAAIDIVIQPLAERRKRLLVADLEATIIENEMLEELGDFIGLRPQIAEITRRAMDGDIDFATALERRVALLAGIQDRVLKTAAERIRVAPGARQLVATMRAAGAITALVSGGFTIFAERVGAELGFDHVIANRIGLSDGRVDGTVMQPIVTGETKRQTLLALAAEHEVPPALTMAVGDGANDLAMLAAAGIGIAFHAKPSVASTARWRISHSDLTSLLYIQGYRRDDFVP